jgi:hypothetical protein
MAQPVFVIKNEQFLEQLCTSINNVIYTVLKTGSIPEIHLLSYNVNTKNPMECDYEINKKLVTALKTKIVMKDINVVLHKNKDTPVELLQFMKNNIDITIGMRYHSLVFSALAAIPILALYESPKAHKFICQYQSQCAAIRGINVADGFDISSFEKELDVFIHKAVNFKNFSMKFKAQEVKLLEKDVKSIVEIVSNRKRKCILRSTILEKGNRPGDFENIERGCVEMVAGYLGVSKEDIHSILYTKVNFLNTFGVSQGKDAENLARFICFQISGSIDDQCIWGLKVNMGNDEFCLHDAIDYIWKEKNKSSDDVKNNDINSETAYLPHSSLFDMVLKKKCFLNIDGHSCNSHIIGFHRSGWEYVLEGLYNLDSYPSNKLADVNVDTYVDRSFHWCCDILHRCGVLPYKQSWIGFIHHTFDETHSSYNCVSLFKNALFLDSLRVCKGLIVLSQYLKVKIEAKLAEVGFGDVCVCVLYHPTGFVDEVFTMEKFLHDNNHRGIVNIGAWLRNPYSIYELDISISNFLRRKMTLNGRSMDMYMPPRDYDKILEGLASMGNTISLKFEDIHEHGACRPSVNEKNKFMTGMACLLKEQYESVQVLSHLSNDDYDKLLSENIVFLNLVDCSAVNTVIECIVRSTPLIVNRHPALEEYLGKYYPGFYSNLAEANILCSDLKRICIIHEYLNMMDKSNLRLVTFLRNFQDIVTDGMYNDTMYENGSTVENNLMLQKLCTCYNIRKYLPW